MTTAEKAFLSPIVQSPIYPEYNANKKLICGIVKISSYLIIGKGKILYSILVQWITMRPYL
ncbi:hypothetical protein SPHINGO8BC_110062 [Sphingobacterium multivorum]|uniref:Uncharacterized protein n=1 Tax=Sphingobacterium multivorum TaxID=28454 RepID=A0A653Y503_SPHMU|nr:hypothetical protein SPHINGO8BC_110062 [Sphingobacterium multivorum]